MCFNKLLKSPKIPAPPPAPLPVERVDAENNADEVRRRLNARRGLLRSIKTSPLGAADFGKNSQVASLSSGSGTVTGV